MIAGFVFLSCGPIIVKSVRIADPHGYREERYSSSRNAPSSESACAGGEVRGESRAPVANRGAITFSIMLANIMQGLDTTIANVALPHIQGTLSASQDQISWC